MKSALKMFSHRTEKESSGRLMLAIGTHSMAILNLDMTKLYVSYEFSTIDAVALDDPLVNVFLVDQVKVSTAQRTLSIVHVCQAEIVPVFPIQGQEIHRDLQARLQESRMVVEPKVEELQEAQSQRESEICRFVELLLKEFKPDSEVKERYVQVGTCCLYVCWLVLIPCTYAGACRAARQPVVQRPHISCILCERRLCDIRAVRRSATESCELGSASAHHTHLKLCIWSVWMFACRMPVAERCRFYDHGSS